MPSTLEKGNAFRDHVARVLMAAAWDLRETEVRANHIKVDALVFGVVDTFGDSKAIYVEAKDYQGNLPKDECHRFINDYGPLVTPIGSAHAWLISKGPITPDGRALVNAQPGLRAMDFLDLQRRLFNTDHLIEAAIADYRRDGVASGMARGGARLAARYRRTVRNG